jgi:hypothetical protein
MDVSVLSQAHDEFLDVAAAGGFGPPPAGEWDAERLLAHMAATDANIASVALAIAAGRRPGYDNRVTLDESNLSRIVAGAGGMPGLIELVRTHGRVLCEVAAALPESVTSVQLAVLIISGTDVVTDEPRPLARLINGNATFHFPRHTEQLARLRRPAG